MMTFTAFFFLAQTALLPSPVTSPPPVSELPKASPHRHQASHPHLHAVGTSTPTPEIRVTIVNATSVPSVSLDIGLGTDVTKATKGAKDANKPISYPKFLQGEWTANQAISTPEVHYAVRSTNGAAVTFKTIQFKPVSSQYLLLTGDLSTIGPPDKLPQLLGDSVPRGIYPPNIQFHVIPYTLVSPDPCHYRIINGMPGKTLLLRSLASENRPAQELAYLAPGNSVLLVHQPACVKYEVVIDEKIIPLEIYQEGAAGNCLIPFFLRNEKPDFVRVFEDP